ARIRGGLAVLFVVWAIADVVDVSVGIDVIGVDGAEVPTAIVQESVVGYLVRPVPVGILGTQEGERIVLDTEDIATAGVRIGHLVTEVTVVSLDPFELDHLAGLFELLLEFVHGQPEVLVGHFIALTVTPTGVLPFIQPLVNATGDILGVSEDLDLFDVIGGQGPLHGLLSGSQFGLVGTVRGPDTANPFDVVDHSDVGLDTRVGGVTVMSGDSFGVAGTFLGRYFLKGVPVD